MKRRSSERWLNFRDKFIEGWSMKASIPKGILFMQSSLVIDSAQYNWTYSAAKVSGNPDPARQVAGVQSSGECWAPRAHLYPRLCQIMLHYQPLPQSYQGRASETLNHVIWCSQSSRIEALSSKVWHLTSCMPVNVD